MFFFFSIIFVNIFYHELRIFMVCTFWYLKICNLNLEDVFVSEYLRYGGAMLVRNPRWEVTTIIVLDFISRITQPTYIFVSNFSSNQADRPDDWQKKQLFQMNMTNACSELEENSSKVWALDFFQFKNIMNTFLWYGSNLLTSRHCVRSYCWNYCQ